MYSTRYSCPNLKKLEFSLQIFEKYWNVNFHENPSSWSRGVLCGQTAMAKLIVAFHNFANALKNVEPSIRKSDLLLSAKHCLY